MVQHHSDNNETQTASRVVLLRCTPCMQEGLCWPTGATPRDQTEPCVEGAPCYSEVLKADLLPGTFVLLADTSSVLGEFVVARVVAVVSDQLSSSSASVQVNIFRQMKEVLRDTEGILHPKVLRENHLRNLTEIVQTAELRVVPTIHIANLSFVFTLTSLQDTTNLFFTCQGMKLAFLLRFRLVQRGNEATEGTSFLVEVPEDDEYCRPFPSSYKNSRYHDCFALRVWNNVMTIKNEMTKLLGRYSQQQGLNGRERCRLANFTLETWRFLCLQFRGLFSDSDSCGVSSRTRVYRITESGLTIKAARIQRSCTIMRFETKAHLLQLCTIFGESVTAGQRCRLPRVSSPKTLWQNDVINAVFGSDECEPIFNPRTVRDGIDLEFDGSSELFITIRYRRYAYSAGLEDCDPLLASLICHRRLADDEGEDHVSNDDDDNEFPTIMSGSEFADDVNGFLYRVTRIDSARVYAKCFYPRRDNDLFDCEKSFDILKTKESISRRLNG